MPAETSMKALAERIKPLAGWRRHGAAFAAGALSVLAMAPFFVWPVLWLTLPVLVWLIDGALSPRKGANDRLRRQDALAAAWVGWWFGFGYFLAGLFWIGEAFLVEAEVFAALLPVAVVLMPAGLALFYAAATALSACFWRPGPIRVIALALALSAMEWLRGHVLSGFPWNGLGYALTYPLPFMQGAAAIGIYGLALIAVLVFALPAVLWAEAPSAPAQERRAKLTALAVAVLPLLALAVYGNVRLAQGTRGTVPGVMIRIVQPSVPQREKWRPEAQERIFGDHLQLSATNAAGQRDDLARITHVVWPEAAMPFMPLEHPEARAAIGRLLPKGVQLITGALRVEPEPANADRPWRFFNSLLVFGQEGSLVALYDKIHLVPFGEFLPLQPLLEAIGLRPLTRKRGRFEHGVTPRPLLRVPGLPAIAPIICYEAVFPGAIIEGQERPGAILNVTNDGWFGNTTGPRQHFHQARVRAVEEGLPLIRAANNGISAMIDGQGRVVARLDLNVRGTIDAELPAPQPAPLYARFGDLGFLLMWLAGAAALARQSMVNRRPTHATPASDI